MKINDAKTVQNPRIYVFLKWTRAVYWTLQFVADLKTKMHCPNSWLLHMAGSPKKLETKIGISKELETSVYERKDW